MSLYNTTFEYCDSDALPAENTAISSLASEQFYKLCPGLHHHYDGSYAPLGQPRCGDGSNFSFLVSRPPEQHQHKQKILIELSGGGACWDDLTCKLQSGFLAYPRWMDAAIGTSCSDPGLNSFLLCAKTIGEVDFSTYTSVFVPYCTQDVHVGDEPNATYDGSNAIHHVGAHNIYRTLLWVFENFPSPSQIFVTGCSAGGTPLPVIYDLINTHYGEQAASIDIIMDSPVYLTPSYFLQDYFPNWNPRTFFKKIGFDFDTYMNEESFPDHVVDYVLQRSKKTDNFGAVFHDNDQISSWYYTLMIGNSFGLRDRRLSLVDPGLDQLDRSATSNIGLRMASDIKSQWWSGINTSMTNAMKSHSNLDFYVIKGDGHCSFSFNVPLQYEGFGDWLSAIVYERNELSNGPVETVNGTVETVAISNGTVETVDMSNATVETSAISNMVATATQSSPIFTIAAMIVLTMKLLS